MVRAITNIFTKWLHIDRIPILNFGINFMFRIHKSIQVNTKYFWRLCHSLLYCNFWIGSGKWNAVLFNYFIAYKIWPSFFELFFIDYSLCLKFCQQTFLFHHYSSCLNCQLISSCCKPVYIFESVNKKLNCCIYGASNTVIAFNNFFLEMIFKILNKWILWNLNFKAHSCFCSNPFLLFTIQTFVFHLKNSSKRIL